MEHALAKTTLFSGFLSTIIVSITMLLIFLSFSLFLMQQHPPPPPPRAKVVKCDGSVYDVDVDVESYNGGLQVWALLEDNACHCTTIVLLDYLALRLSPFCNKV